MFSEAIPKGSENGMIFRIPDLNGIDQLFNTFAKLVRPTGW